MPNNAEAIQQLETTKRTLQAQCNSASGVQVLQLMTVIHQLTDEIAQIELLSLNSAGYIPQTPAFRKATDEAKAFVANLAVLRSAFATIGSIASSIDALIKLVS